MPVRHLNIRIVQRSKGNSAVAGAAYQAGEKLFSEYDQKPKDHRIVNFFAPVKAIRAKHRCASPLQDYTDVALSTYKKFRMVIPNFL